MAVNNEEKGFQTEFLGRELVVDFPKFPNPIWEAAASRLDNEGKILTYPNYSVIQHAGRKLPLITASNIDGRRIIKIPREEVGNSWKLDRRIAKEHQLGNSFYASDKSDFDKGHMTKREDVQWGQTEDQAKVAAKATFYYTNAVPQHASLNRKAWRALEDYILHSKAVKLSRRIVVFTGPLLDENDPDFVTPIKEEYIKIPTLFWKVIYFTRSGKKLYRVSFLYGQKSVLEDSGIVFKTRSIAPVETLFMDFEYAKTFQVHTSVIETLTGFSFTEAIDPYQQKQKPLEMIVQEVNLRGNEVVQVIPEMVL